MNTPASASSGLGQWRPGSRAPAFIGALPIRVAEPDRAWFKLVPDPSQGEPLAHVQAAWIENGSLHWVTIDGIDLAAPSGFGPTQQVVSSTQIAVGQIVRLEGFSIVDPSGDAVIVLADGSRHPGAPGLLVNQLL